MRAILFGLLLGALLAFPATAATLGTTALAVISQPLAVAFAAGVVARPALAHRMRRWTP